MISKAKIAFILTAILWIIAVNVWPGCATAPLRPSRTPILSRKTADFAFVQPPPPSRSEVIAKLGEPDFYLPDLRVACYRVNTVTRRDVFLFLVIPLRIRKLPEPGFDVAFIEFDEHDHVKRSGVALEPGYFSYEAAAKKWMATEDKPKP